MKAIRKTDVSPIRYHTKWLASNEINFPKTAVNPHRKTMKCKRNCADIYSILNWRAKINKKYKTQKTNLGKSIFQINTLILMIRGEFLCVITRKKYTLKEKNNGIF